MITGSKVERSVALAALLLTACGEESRRRHPVDQDSTNSAVNDAPIPPPATARDAATALPRPAPQVDANSAAAARQLVQNYARLLRQGRFEEAAKLWSDRTAAQAAATELGRAVLKTGEAGPLEGAAGSIYTTIPVVNSAGAKLKRGDVILKRVNDVPGSTAEQRRWHIERIEWRNAG